MLGEVLSRKARPIVVRVATLIRRTSSPLLLGHYCWRAEESTSNGRLEALACREELCGPVWGIEMSAATCEWSEVVPKGSWMGKRGSAMGGEAAKWPG